MSGESHPETDPSDPETDPSDPETDPSDLGGDPSDPEIALIAAVAENGVIGREGGMPWHYPADLEHFKRTTTGHPVVMGRTTYESIADRIGGPLPDRISVVLTTRDIDLPDGVLVAGDLEEAMDLAREAAAELGVGTVYVIGGATVYEAFMDRADRLILTEIHDRYDGDTYFPERDGDAWREVEREDREQLSFVTYERR